MAALTWEDSLTMTRWKVRTKRYGGPWYGNDRQRVSFERGAKQHFPALRGDIRTSGNKAGRTYRVILDVPHYEQRRVEILFSKQAPRLARITADGPDRLAPSLQRRRAMYLVS